MSDPNLLSMIKSLYEEIRNQNKHKSKPKEAKKIANELLKVEKAINASKLPTKEKQIYVSKIRIILSYNSGKRNFEKIDERDCKIFRKVSSHYLENIISDLENSYVKPKS